MLIAVVAALAAGACFALAGVLQQRAASARPEYESLSLRLLLHLCTQPVWLAGIALALLAYVCQALALAHGPLTLVQPLIVSELIFAIPLSARLYRTRLRGREWLGIVAVTGGLATALGAASPDPGSPVASVTQWLLTLGSVAALAGAVLLGSRRFSGAPRASLIAVAGGLVMGLQSVLLDAAIEQLGESAVQFLTAWQTYLMVAVSIGGLLLIQSAFQAGPLAASMPVFDAVEPAVAITVGVLLFGETVRGGWVAGPLTVAGTAVLVAGIVLLDTSPLLARARQG
ncbi:DMT family transporter [Streptomyces oceani]|uniref:Multidrug DMT transporter permease n=1 Tax=Streptomyces oceani TaxID=1075402 RepID=A0A1E7JXK6_9ACTN|nr:DMT family transporter [Streptomyces oceani]OEU96399.1 hypothetical protein AN216_20620 [Streptomyces oceani]